MKTIAKVFKKLIDEHYIFFCIILSVLINFAIESAARMSVIGGFLYFSKHPFYFFYNVILIMLTYSISLLFKKRTFMVSIISVWWIIACITNSFLIHYRHTPFIAADFFVIKSALDVIHLYVSKFQMIVFITGTILAISFLIFTFIKEKLKTPDYRKISLLLSVTIIFSLLPVDFISAEKDRTPKTNLTDEAYKYGFVCCFLNSVFNSGINKPDKYSEGIIDNIVNSINTDFNLENINHNSKPTIKPNIVVIQLESFVDPYKIKTAEYNKDPIPTFRKLQNEYSSGKLGVSVYGGGTANTEFEVLTGMSTNFFGIGEYPYETILHDQPVESICYNLAELGYTSHAIHNHTATFYDRHIVYKNLGFNTFTSLEYMNDLTYNALGWAKSDVFTEHILDALNSTKEQDFVFAVTVQGHGKYPETVYPKFPYKLTGGSELVMDMKGGLEYYINELNEEDKWLNEMLTELESYPEPVMAIIYGDHMPSLNSPDEILDEDDIYATDYVIWTNYKTEIIDKKLETYNLFSHALSFSNINNGILTKLHQYGVSSGKIYSDDLHKIQYDMLYGEKFVYNQKESPHKPTEMKMGVKDIVIENIDIKSNTTTIFGKNFTPCSFVYVDGNEVRTTFVDENTLKINSKSCQDYDEITVVQKASNSTKLSETEPYLNPDISIEKEQME